jgi:hypothetical protein
VRFLEHAVGLSDPGGEPDVELQPSPGVALEQLEKIFRPWSLSKHENSPDLTTARPQLQKLAAAIQCETTDDYCISQ